MFVKPLLVGARGVDGDRHPGGKPSGADEQDLTVFGAPCLTRRTRALERAAEETAPGAAPVAVVAQLSEELARPDFAFGHGRCATATP
jgi:hypothetical protein